MTQNRDYLSDEELELLIADVEQNELVMAPPDLLEGILDYIDKSAQERPVHEKLPEQRPVSDKPSKTASNIREFRRYYFKVCASVSAAVFLIFAIPAASDNSAANVPEREKFATESKFATKEEALKNESLMKQKFGGNNIFRNDREWGIFNGENGG